MNNMIKKKYPNYHQVLTINKEGNQEYIRTGATFNNIEYISMPVILAMYCTSDPTLRKYLKDRGTAQDYFLADGRLFISLQFLKENRFYLKSKNTSTYHPYKKEKITGARLPYIISNSKPSLDKEDVKDSIKCKCTLDKEKIVSELKKVNWDYFITINTSSHTSQDYWDLTMLKFIDQLSDVVNDKGVLAAYSTEFDYDNTDRRIRILSSNHRHLHLLVMKNANSIHLKTIKGLLLSAMGRKTFRKNEFHISMYDKSMWATTYILKQYNSNPSCFSLISPSL